MSSKASNGGRDIREVFGVDYLLSPNATSESLNLSETPATDSPPGVSDLIEQAKQAKRTMQMKVILDRLNRQPSCKLDEFLDIPSLGMEFPELLSLAGEMERKALITVRQRDRLGNWEIAISPQGRQFLAVLSS